MSKLPDKNARAERTVRVMKKLLDSVVAASGNCVLPWYHKENILWASEQDGVVWQDLFWQK